MKRDLLAAIFCLVALADTAAPRQRALSDTAKQFAFENPSFGSIVVASVGRQNITAQEFLQNYEFGPAFPKRETNSKRRYLDFMIYEKLLAFDGFSGGLDKGDDAKISFREIEGDLATEELYKDDILRKATISQQEVERGIERSKITLMVQWIYTRAETEITKDAATLRKGVPFDSLYRLRRNALPPEDVREMEISRFALSVKNPELSRVVDTLRVGRPSAPVQGPDGWYILCVRSASAAPMLTETAAGKLREEVRRSIVQHRCDSLSDLYVKHLMESARPTIIRRTLDVLHVMMAKQIVPADTFSRWGLERRLRERWGINDFSAFNRSEHLVESQGGAYTLANFQEWYRAREMNLHLALGSAESLYASAERLVWRMVRDRLLTALALKRKLQDREIVRRQFAWWKDKIVYNIAKARIAGSVSTDSSLVRAYYEANTQRFRDATGVVIPYERVREDVLKEYYNYEITKRTVHEVLKLKERYPVTVNEKALEALPVETENNPKALDMYFGKTGGIFPRPAFPTIDYAWSAWN